RSELVREEGFSIDVFLPITLALSRTSSLLRPSGRSLEAFTWSIQDLRITMSAERVEDQY
ncbi:hypothetical protein, partial [Pseudomonas syringae]|uniref:hypothetical protein n=1 Tax=Pseudomonas syringae TaxID=317 RepID=UPI001F307564